LRFEVESIYKHEEEYYDLNEKWQRGIELHYFGNTGMRCVKSERLLLLLPEEGEEVVVQ